MLSREDIDTYFRTRDWRYLKRGDDVWHTGFMGRMRNYRKGFEIFVNLASDWVYLQTPLLIANERKQQHSLYDFLLEINHYVFLAKFCIYRNQIILAAELPRSCSIDQFNDALWSIHEYAEHYFLEILTIVSDPEIAMLWLNRERGSDGLSFEYADEIPEIIFND